MSDAIKIKSFFLKCDAPGCLHQEPCDAITEQLIGKPCPKCGADLLTREDFDAMQTHLEYINVLNDALEIPDDATGECVLLSVNPHAGDVHFTLHGPKHGGGSK